MDTGHIANHFDCAAQLFSCSISQKTEGLFQHHPKGKYANPRAHLKNTHLKQRDKLHCLGHVLPLNSLAGAELRQIPQQEVTHCGVAHSNTSGTIETSSNWNNHGLFKVLSLPFVQWQTLGYLLTGQLCHLHPSPPLCPCCITMKGNTPNTEVLEPGHPQHHWQFSCRPGAGWRTNHPPLQPAQAETGKQTLCRHKLTVLP